MWRPKYDISVEEIENKIGNYMYFLLDPYFYFHTIMGCEENPFML